MKRSLVFIMALLLATPALGAVIITCSDEGNGVLKIGYDASGESELVRAFALDITLDAGATFAAIDGNSYSEGQGEVYGIFPGSIDLTDLNSPVWGTPIAPSTDPGASGTGLGTNRVIIEMGSLYEPNLTGPPTSDAQLCQFQLNLTADCNVTIVAEVTRGGVVLEDGSTASISSSGCLVAAGGDWPPCWDNETICHGDGSGNGTVGTEDFGPFRDGFLASHPDQRYIDNACGDFSRNGTIGTEDFGPFRDNFLKPVPADCPKGDPLGVW